MLVLERAVVLLVRNGPPAVEKDANCITALIGRDNSVILLWEKAHEGVILMLNCCRIIKCWYMISLAFSGVNTVVIFLIPGHFLWTLCYPAFPFFYSLPHLLSPPFLLITSSSPSKWCSEQLTHVQSLPTMPRLSHRHSLPPPHTSLSLFLCDNRTRMRFSSV